VVQAIRPPGAWPKAQREFRERYDADPSAVPRHDAHVEWWVNMPPALGPPGLLGLVGGLAGVLGRWWAGRGMTEGGFVAVFAPTTLPGARPVMVFPVGEDVDLPDAPNGMASGPAVVAGEIGLNACCCVELPTGPVLWPAYNPTIPSTRSRRRGGRPAT
jgi:hypothetical protein